MREGGTDYDARHQRYDDPAKQRIEKFQHGFLLVAIHICSDWSDQYCYLE
jgi:hypothetical protein